MARYTLSIPTQLQAAIQLPASKSISNRALIIHALARSTQVLSNLSDCDDTRVMINALKHLEDVIDIGAAGTSMRFLTAYLSVAEGTHTITGSERMQQRPIQVLVDALRILGADISYKRKEGYPPLLIRGTSLKGGKVSLRGNVSSQYISALLMIGPVLPEGLSLQLTGDIISRPYIELTLQLMRDFDARAEWISGQEIRVWAQPYRGRSFLVESDWSAASYWYQLAALAEKAAFDLDGLFANSYQGDSRGAEVFSKLGIETVFTEKGVSIYKKENAVTYLEEDFIDIPDLAQTLVVTCALLGVHFRFTGLQTLRIKETDRIHALVTEMRKLGYVLKDEHDSVLMWDGERCEPEAVPVISTYEDHRMAMAFAPAALKFPQMRIADPQVVTKSYPGYWEDLKKAGVRIDNQ
ncbi:MAG: 3-phosphoshikimate 1-carboxyvinyltransferase [Bacteroides sp.]|nr:3-phosphoshikimate 1-carboxyvinyltransferase [Bacteroides sp.]